MQLRAPFSLLAAPLLSGCAGLLGNPVDFAPRLIVLDKPDVLIETALPIKGKDNRYSGAFFGRAPLGSPARTLEIALELWTDDDGDGVHDEGEVLTRSSFASSAGMRDFKLPYGIEVKPPTPLAGKLEVTTTESSYTVPLFLPTAHDGI